MKSKKLFIFTTLFILLMVGGGTFVSVYWREIAGTFGYSSDVIRVGMKWEETKAVLERHGKRGYTPPDNPSTGIESIAVHPYDNKTVVIIRWNKKKISIVKIYKEESMIREPRVWSMNPNDIRLAPNSSPKYEAEWVNLRTGRYEEIKEAKTRK